MQLSTVRIPSYAIDHPIKDIINGKNVSKNKYLRLSSFMPTLSYAWEALDFLTKDDAHGLNCYMLQTKYFFWAAPTYGNNLQNRVLNFRENITVEPDAFIHYFNSSENNSEDKDPAKNQNKKFRLKDILLDPKYEAIVSIITARSKAMLIVKKDFILSKKKSKLLTDYYKDLDPAGIEIANDIKPFILPNIPILASSVICNAIKNLEISGQISNPVYLTYREFEVNTITSKKWNDVYTFDYPLDGFVSTKVYDGSMQGAEVVLYRNTRQ